MEDVRALTAHMGPFLGNVPQADWVYRYNDRLGTSVSLETNEDVRLMLREWELCHRAANRVKQRHFILTDLNVAIDYTGNLRPELHVFLKEDPPLLTAPPDPVLVALHGALNFTDPEVDVGE